MSPRKLNEAGETLVEIVIAMVLIGLVVGAFLAAHATASTATATHRDLVTADAILRDYAEATKADVRRDCPSSSTFTTTTIAGLSVTSNTNQCPVDKFSVRQVDLTTTMPNGTQKRLSIDVRTP